MIKYEKVISVLGTESINRTNEDGTITNIPMDEANSDYQAYLASLDEQQAAAKDAAN